MGKSFHKVTVCIAGTFGAQNDKIKQWVEVNGGTFSKKGIKIVSYEWLEDSLLSKSKRPKREAPYLLTAKMEAGRKKARAQKNKGKDGNTTRQLSELDGYHPYTDNTGHRYSAILVRPGPLPRRKERHVLKVRVQSPNCLRIPFTRRYLLRSSSPIRSLTHTQLLSSTRGLVEVLLIFWLRRAVSSTWRFVLLINFSKLSLE
ncbi:BRCT domain-containing protein, variant [Coccidioides immitis RS]|uniref:BRCT domain-containing protein, variant n=1 Tax=Coccidioides immitis (strain RS) TaxID=246410 RepID=A0A0D8JWI1_COCIM|nr:BRCT domain-containing protein, variant [Coccidioides immitis RS]KJF60633.1 BRCT domain-containing protein, variant [Coccidioides immitis RS]